jgi:hypothetical protein
MLSLFADDGQNILGQKILRRDAFDGQTVDALGNSAARRRRTAPPCALGPFDLRQNIGKPQPAPGRVGGGECRWPRWGRAMAPAPRPDQGRRR